MNTPRNISDALRQAKCWEKAQGMKAEGYVWNTICKNFFRIFKPENTTQDKADYVVDLTAGMEHCNCPDFEKHEDYCKHTLFMQAEVKAQEDAAQQVFDLAACEATFAAYDAEKAALQTGLIDELLPAPFDYQPPVLTVADVLEALQARVVRDIDRIETNIETHAKRRVNYIQAGQDFTRQRDLQGALNIINEYWQREQVGHLQLQPALNDTL